MKTFPKYLFMNPRRPPSEVRVVHNISHFWLRKELNVSQCLSIFRALNLRLSSSECIRKAFSKEQSDCVVHILYCRSLEYLVLFAKLLFLVTLLFAKERFREEYNSDWSKETRILKDNFYSILRTIYRNKFGANFIRVVVNGFSKYSTGELVVNTAVLLQPHPDNYGDLLQLWSDQVSRRHSVICNCKISGQDVCTRKIQSK